MDSQPLAIAPGYSTLFRYYAEGLNPEMLARQAEVYKGEKKSAQAIASYQQAITAMDKIHHYIHYETSYLHLLAAKYYREQQNDGLVKTHLDAALFQDHCNDEARALQEGTGDATGLYSKQFSYLFDFHHFLWWEQPLARVNNIPTLHSPHYLYYLYYRSYWSQLGEQLAKGALDPYLAAMCYSKMGDEASALKHWQKADSLEAHIDASIYLHGRHKPREAEEWLQGAGAHSHYKALLVRYYLTRDPEMLQEAIGLYQSFHSAYHQQASRYYTGLAKAYQQAESESCMLAACYKAIDLYAANDEAWEIIIGYFEGLGEWGRVVSYYEQWAKADPAQQQWIAQRQIQCLQRMQG